MLRKLLFTLTMLATTTPALAAKTISCGLTELDGRTKMPGSLQITVEQNSAEVAFLDQSGQMMKVDGAENPLKGCQFSTNPADLKQFDARDLKQAPKYIVNCSINKAPSTSVIVFDQKTHDINGITLEFGSVVSFVNCEEKQ